MLFIPERGNPIVPEKARIEFKIKNTIKICSIRNSSFSEDIIYLKVLIGENMIILVVMKECVT